MKFWKSFAARCKEKELCMMRKGGAFNADDPFDLERFVSAQKRNYDSALSELKKGMKRTHWMWYVFPQIDGLGSSHMAKLYAIKSVEEARQYLDHSVLGNRLNECAEALMVLQGLTASEIFGYPDDVKLRSSMTLFEHVAGPGSVFGSVLDKYFNGERDLRTLQILDMLG